MAKGGRENQDVTMPKFFETALQQGIGMATDLSQAPYAEYRGPDVAAFSPMQQAAFQGTDQMAGAFGMPTTGGQSYMPEAVTAGGAIGYSAAPIYDAARANMGQAANQYYSSFGIDPNTGAVGSRAATQQPVNLEMQSSGRGGK